MSSHCIYIQCFECGKQEALYTGRIYSEDFDDSDWEMETIGAVCIECKADDDPHKED